MSRGGLSRVWRVCTCRPIVAIEIEMLSRLSRLRPMYASAMCYSFELFFFEIVSKLFLEMSDYLRYLLHQLTFTIISSRWKITIFFVSFALKSLSVSFFCTLLRQICYDMNWNLHLKLLLPCNFIRCLTRPLSLLLLISFELQYKRDGNCIQTSRSMAVLCPCHFIIAFKKTQNIFVSCNLLSSLRWRRRPYPIFDWKYKHFYFSHLSVLFLAEIWQRFSLFHDWFPLLQHRFSLNQFQLSESQHRLSFWINWRLKTTDSTKIYT